MIPRILLGVVGVSLLWLPGPVGAQGVDEARLIQNLSSLERRYESLLGRTQLLDVELNDGPLGRSSVAVRRQFDEAVYDYLLGEYERCALRMFVLLDGGELTGDPLRTAEARWYLGDALMQIGNYLAARVYLQELVDQGADGAFFEDAIDKLLEIHGILRELPDSDAVFENYYPRFEAAAIGQGGSPRVRYALGKALFLRAEYERCLQILAGFPDDVPRTVKAYYLFGTAWAGIGHRAGETGDSEEAATAFDNALTSFRALLDLESRSADHDEVLDLARIGIGRVELDLGRPEAALASYNDVSTSSVHYSEALYESMWSLIESGSWQAALRHIEIFARAFPDDPRILEIELLAAHLQVKKESWEDGVRAYKAYSIQYSPERDRLDGLLQRSVDPAVYFDQLMGQEAASAEEAMTPLVMALAKTDNRVQRNMALAGELAGELDTLAAMRTLADELQAALSRPGGGPILESFRAARESIGRVEVETDDLDAALVGLEADFILVTSEYDRSLQELEGPREQLRATHSGGNVPRSATLGLANRLRERRGLSKSASAKDVYARIDSVRSRLSKLRRWALASEDRLAGMEGGEVDKLRGMLERELVVLAELERDAAAEESAAAGLTTVVAESSFLRVLETLFDLVLRADAGVVDVHWALRDQAQREFRTAAQGRAAALDTVDAEYGVLLDGFFEADADGDRP